MALSWRAVLIAALAAGVVVAGAAVLDEALETPPAFCPDDVDSDEPEDVSSLSAPPRSGVALFDVAGNGDMTDRGDQLDGRLPNTFTRDALICQYQRESDEELGSCGLSTKLLATRYAYKVYEFSSKRLLGEFELLGHGRCPTGIRELPAGSSSLNADPDYPALVERLVPLLT
ncbi:hypothetical protein [Amycolatopsis albispora]|uniref:DUF3558 domain-containing protein n=1 Tax=Amycolatopsis albispora TaxID=1804986 RepID=A0A344L2V6_9PSEU|nr:hypothetical protein [Amycolatopsis albispora]AXB42380.1 hypothetical protein A4R43_07440 [Amycolatopsis albispora]